MIESSYFIWSRVGRRHGREYGQKSDVSRLRIVSLDDRLEIGSDISQLEVSHGFEVEHLLLVVEAVCWAILHQS